MTDAVCLGAYATQEEAEEARLSRSESQQELVVVEDGDQVTPWRVWWFRSS